MDSRDRGETLAEFLDHAALVSDADQYDESARITLMTLHAAKGLEFPLVFLIGLEEGLFPHSRTLLAPDDIEEERRLCYVGMTRAMDTLILSRARYRRRYGTDMPEASVPSRFLEEVPQELMQDLGSPQQRPKHDFEQRLWHQPSLRLRGRRSAAAVRTPEDAATQQLTAGQTYNSIDNIAEFFASRGKKFTRPKVEVPAVNGTHRIQARTARDPSEIRRGNRLQARGRWGRCEDYGTISKIRFEKAGRKVRPTAKGVNHVI